MNQEDIDQLPAPRTDACIKKHRPFAGAATAEQDFDAMSLVARRLEQERLALITMLETLCDQYKDSTLVRMHPGRQNTMHDACQLLMLLNRQT